MNLLAIDTSTEFASIALLAGNELSCEEQNNQKTHAQFLLPMIDRLLVNAGLSLKQLDGIVFGCGPGSFTGLRIACSIAKGLAYAHDLGLIPVSSLDTIAYGARKQKEYNHSPILAVLDARMHELYWGYYAPGELLAQAHVNGVHDIALPANSQSVVLAGVGMDLYWSDCPERIKSQVSAQISLYPKADMMIQLAQDAAIAPISASEAHPQYVRNQVVQGAKRG